MGTGQRRPVDANNVVSVSHVRFDDGSLLDAARVAAACHAQGALLVLDVSQSCGAVPNRDHRSSVPAGEIGDGRASLDPSCICMPSKGGSS